MSRPDHATIFSRCCHVFKKKAKAIELPFFAKESGKKDWADKIVASDAARVRESGAGQLCGGDFVALFMSADHVDQKATCIVSYPAYYHSYPAARISASITALGSLISVSLESVVVA